MKFQIRYGTKDSCSYSYFDTHETDLERIKAISKVEIRKSDSKYYDRGSFSLSLGIDYRSGKKLIREYDSETNKPKENGIEFIL